MHANWICIDILSVNILSILLFLPCWFALHEIIWKHNNISDVYFNPVTECRYHFLDSILLFVCLFACLFICLLCMPGLCQCAPKLPVRFRVIAWRALIYGVDKSFFPLSSFHRHWMFCFHSFNIFLQVWFLLVALSLSSSHYSANTCFSLIRFHFFHVMPNVMPHVMPHFNIVHTNITLAHSDVT